MTISFITPSPIIRSLNRRPRLAKKALSDILNYTNKEMKQAISERKPLATTAGKRSLIFRGAITGVDSSKEGLQFYEVIPVAMIIAGTQAATGHRTMDTNLFFEGELIDAATHKPVVKVVRKGRVKISPTRIRRSPSRP